MRRSIFGLCVLALVFSTAGPAHAQSNDECAIWLCAPFGFVLPNCGKAFRAMLKRVSKLKPAFPSWRSCEVADSGVSMSFREGKAALMAEEVRRCVDPGSGVPDFLCQVWEVVAPGEYIKDTICYDVGYGEEPKGCIATYNYVETYQDGELYGDTYYWPQ